MMGLSVLHPGILIAGLACIAIPVLVHLLRRKHRPIAWGAMRFLEQAYRKRRRLITIEQLLLLLTRCAIVALIAAGVGSLVLGSGLADQRPRTMILVLDNSIHSASMLDSGTSSIETQQQRALSLLSTLDPTRGDRAAFITLASPARGDAVPATSELGLIRSRIESTTATDAQRDLSGAMGLVSQVIDGIEDDSIPEPALILSASGWDASAASEEFSFPGVDTVLLDAPASTARPNIAITLIEPLRPMITRSAQSDRSSDEIQGLRVVLTRSDASSPQTTRLSIEDAPTQTPLVSINLRWSAGQDTLSQSVPLDPSTLTIARGGSAILRATIDHPDSTAGIDSNPRDNTRLVGLPVRRHISVGIIDSFHDAADPAIRPSRWVRAVLGADDGLVSIQQINARSAGDRIDPTLDVLFILAPDALDEASWQRIVRLSEMGMPIILTPAPTDPTLDWASHLDELSPGMLARAMELRTHQPPIGLGAALPTTNDLPSSQQNTLLAGLDDEYADLASSVGVFQSLDLAPGTNARAVLTDSTGAALVLINAPSEGHASSTAPVVLLGVAFDDRWTDLPARPLFVAMMHEMLRSLLARSIAPQTALAGQSAATLGLDDLESLTNSAASTSDPRLGGAYVRVDPLGTGTRAVIINPDDRLTTAHPEALESVLAVIERDFEGTPVRDLSAVQDLASDAIGQASSPGRSIALMLFAIAAVLGIVEFVLARRCSYKAVGAPTLQTGGMP